MPKMVEVWEVEETDTFGGEANYAWVNREEIEIPAGSSDLATIRRIKRAAGYNGVRCEVWFDGDNYTIRPIGRNASCTIVFAYYRGEREAINV